MPLPRSPTPRPPAARPWLVRTASAFVLGTLIALLVVPVLVQRRVDELRLRVEAAEPARTLVARLQFDLVREMAALTELRLTQASEFAEAYEVAERDERLIVARLAPLAASLGTEVHGPFVRVKTLAEQWHTQIDAYLDPSAETAGLYPDPRANRLLFQTVIAGTEALDAAILRVTAQNRAQITAAERAGLRFNFALGFLALLAAAAVANLMTRVQRFAREAERRRDEAEAALQEVARANDARVRLLRGITHDVKNPLGAAKGYADLLVMGVKAPLQPAQAPLVEGLQRSVDGALAIITDLLDFAQAGGDGFVVRRQQAELGKIVREAVEDHEAAAVAAGHAITLERAEPIEVHTDEARVRQVLGNLISNAIKYTPAPGRITVRTELIDVEQPERPGSWAVVKVSDSGPGPLDQREAIFDEFTRLENRGDAPGHGLGLAIALRIARLLDGDLTIEDAETGGAAFLLWLPRRKEITNY